MYADKMNEKAMHILSDMKKLIPIEYHGLLAKGTQLIYNQGLIEGLEHAIATITQ